MTIERRVELEYRVATRVRQYLALEQTARELAEQGRDLCSAVTWLLGELLSVEPTWSRYAWVDSILPTSIRSQNDGALELRGAAVARDGPLALLQPVRARLWLDVRLSGLAAFELNFGHVDGAVEYEAGFDVQNIRLRQDESEWSYTFLKKATPEERPPG